MLFGKLMLQKPNILHILNQGILVWQRSISNKLRITPNAKVFRLVTQKDYSRLI